MFLIISASVVYHIIFPSVHPKVKLRFKPQKEKQFNRALKTNIDTSSIKIS